MSLILEWLASLMPHLMLAPIVLPMLTAALMLLLKEEQQKMKMVMNAGATLVGLLVAIALLLWADQSGSNTTMG
ncbi:MAG TPA: cation:proton antiporter, partial [Comamonas sp.]